MTAYERHAWGFFIEHLVASCRADFVYARKSRLFFGGFARASFSPPVPDLFEEKQADFDRTPTERLGGALLELRARAVELLGEAQRLLESGGIECSDHYDYAPDSVCEGCKNAREWREAHAAWVLKIKELL